MKAELINAIKKQAASAVDGIHTAFPGVILEIDYDAGTCNVQPYALLRTMTNDKLMYPMLYDVPIVVPQSCVVDACVAYPIRPGDTCLIVISEGTLDYWRYDRVTASDFKFDLGSAICIPGLTRTFNPCFKEAADDGAIILKYGNGKFKLTNDTMTITAENLVLDAAKNLTLTAGQSVSVAGQSVGVSGSSAASVSGGTTTISGGTTSVTGSGSVTISGSRVDIN